MSHDPDCILDAVEPTWPPERRWESAGLVLRAGAGGGKRVSAASQLGDTAPDDAALTSAEEEMRHLGQAPLFSLRPEHQALDAALAARGYRTVDPTRLYHIPVAKLTERDVPPVTCFAIWPPLAIMSEIWAAGGIGPARVAVMERVTAPKTGLFARVDNRPAGAGFLAAHHGIALLHALEVLTAHRRKGLARWMIHAAGHWAARQGCDTLALLVTEANGPANALYQSMGFAAAPGYHYRILEE